MHARPGPLDGDAGVGGSSRMPRARQRFELIRIPVPKDHVPRPHARITAEDRRIVRDYLACKGDVASVCAAHGKHRGAVHYTLVKLCVWKRWAHVGPPLPRCGHCRRPLPGRRQRYHRECRRNVDAARAAKILNRARKLLAAGLTVRETAVKVGRSAVYLSSKLPGLALTNEQRRRRGLPPATRLHDPPPSSRTRSLAQRELEWVLVPVRVPPTYRRKPPERLNALERRGVKGYLACGGDVEPVAQALGMSSAWLRIVLARAQIWRRWKKRPAARPPCVVCGRPLPNIRPGTRHQACWEKQRARRHEAWVARARTLLAKGWTLQRVADDVGITRGKVAEALRGHARASDIRLAESDARLRKFARHVKAGLSRREAGLRVGYAPNTVHGAAGRAARKGYL